MATLRTRKITEHLRGRIKTIAEDNNPAIGFVDAGLTLWLNFGCGTGERFYQLSLTWDDWRRMVKTVQSSELAQRHLKDEAASENLPRRPIQLVPRTLPECPDCGGRLEYRESTVCARSLGGVDDSGVLYIEPSYDAWDCNGDDEHLACQDCLAEFEVPIEVEYDYYQEDEE